MFSRVFKGTLAGIYRRTRDGRLVAGFRTLPFFRKKWFLVHPEDQEDFEERFVQGQSLSMALVAGVIVPFMIEADFVRMLMVCIASGVTVGHLSFLWSTHGLPEERLGADDLEPLSQGEQHLRSARAIGPRMLWGMFAASLVMLALQISVLVTDREWWSWLGIAMFGACTVYFGVLIARLERAPSEVERSHP
jgi:hypothetical protein